ncbi:MAG: hypothetical protein K2I71_01245, partial [Helicobacter sp.]|nr:hypothetical protein [Helicobacter sp.]
LIHRYFVSIKEREWKIFFGCIFSLAQQKLIITYRGESAYLAAYTLENKTLENNSISYLVL